MWIQMNFIRKHIEFTINLLSSVEFCTQSYRFTYNNDLYITTYSW